MRLSDLLLVSAVALPASALAQDINISKCEDSVRRQIYVSADRVAVVRTYHGPSAAILLRSSTPSEIAYVWRYRETDKAPVTTDAASLRVDAARSHASVEKPLMDVGSFVIEWNLAATPVSSLFYCPTLALVLYYPKSQFDQLPPND